ARYAVVVTRDVRDRRGERIGRSEAFHHFAREGDRERDGRNPELDTYRRALREALAVAERSGIEHSKIAVMSVFTTLSSSALFLKLRDHVGALPAPEPASFLLGPGGTRSVFAVPQITAMTFNRDVGTNPATGATILSSVSLASRIGAMRIVPGVLGRLAFGSLVAPRYDNEGSIARIPSRTGEVRQLGTRTLTFVLFLPSGPMPPGGWPTVLYGYGGADNKQNGPYLVAAAMAESGFATIAIDLPGNGFGERSTVTVATGARSTTVLAGGRSFDQNGDGVIAVNEGANAAPPRTLLLGTDRGIQGVTDVLHLIRVIEAGMDADGDGARDLDPSRIYAFGFSAGGGVMEIAMGLEPKIRAGVFNSAGIGGGDGLPFGPARPAAGAFIAARKPPLNNVPPAVGITEVGDGKPAPFGSICVNVPPLFNDTPVLPHRPTVVSAVPGAMVIREFLDRLQWVSQPGSSAGMLMHLRRRFPVTSVAPVLFQRSKGDQTALNFAGLDVLRAAGFEDRITWLRYSDKVFDGKLQANPHNISQRTDSPDAATRALALALQRQAAQFLASDGTFVPDPDGAAPVFEFPISDPDAYGLNYVPAPCPPGT
ncbi:MAG: alpha/beta hydrolase family protein, partial [Myxococcales bacterium]